jgi:Domain of unknown function (DUF1906)
MARSIAPALFAVLLWAVPSAVIAQAPPARTYLGFDANDYPGDAGLANLRSTFAFAGYWLNNPPGDNTNSWAGKRTIVEQDGFGFLLLFNGRLDKQLKSTDRARGLGKGDGAQAVQAARREGFPADGIIFLDQEEGGRLLDEQTAYLFAWIDAVIAGGFRTGVYCSGMASPDGPGRTITTADDIRAHANGRQIAFFIYNDACPPAPGCVRASPPPPPSGSGLPYASVWQFAQSPRRPEYTRSCRATYAKDGNCYPSAEAADALSIFVDMESALSADPSNGRK